MPYIVIDVKNALIILIAAIHFGLALLVLLRTKIERPNLLFGMLELTLLSWGIAMVFFRSAPTIELSILWARILYTAAIFIPWTFVYFVSAFSGREHFSRKLWHSIIIAAFPLILIRIIFFGNTFISNVIFTPGEKTIVFNQELHFLYALYILGYFFIAFVLLFTAYSKTEDYIKKIRLRFVIIGTLISTLIGSFTNLFLPLFGVFTFNWFGQISIIILAVSTTYAIFRHNLLNIKLIAIELFTAFIILTLLVDIFLVETPQEFLLKLLILVAVAFFAVLIIRSALSEVRNREEIEKLARDLQVTNEELARVSQAKSDFLSIASHQLKTPLSIIKGYLSLITEGSFGRVSKKMQEPLQRIYISNERLISLVEDLLNLSRIEDGRMKYDLTKEDLVPIITSVHDEFKEQAKQHGIKLLWQPPPNPFYAYIDKVKIRNVIFNLTDNAIKYTEQGSVTLSINQKGAKVTIRVSDTGIGIDKDHLGRLFAKFTRLRDGNRNFSISGFGLGLYITKLIVRDHKGRVWAESPGLGKGSTFSLELPLMKG